MRYLNLSIRYISTLISSQPFNKLDSDPLSNLNTKDANRSFATTATLWLREIFDFNESINFSTKRANYLSSNLTAI